MELVMSRIHRLDNSDISKAYGDYFKEILVWLSSVCKFRCSSIRGKIKKIKKFLYSDSELVEDLFLRVSQNLVYLLKTEDV